MRKIGLILAAAVILPAAAHAQTTYTYDFSTATAGTTPPANTFDTGVIYQGYNSGSVSTSNTPGTIGNDNWTFASTVASVGTAPNTQPGGAIIRSDARPGLSGNYASAYPIANNAQGYDTINSRVNNSNFGYSIPQGSKFTVAFTSVIVTTPAATAGGQFTNSRTEAWLGRDQATPTTGGAGTPDGKIRGTAATTENAEWGPIFGYDSSNGGTFGGGLYIRPASLGTAVTTPITLTGTYRFALEIDPTVNPNTTNGGNDGAGTMTYQQLFDANGNAVTDTVHTAFTNFNLGLSRMNVAANGGTPTGWDPSTWNGIVTRLAFGGAIDSISITTPEPTSLAVLGLAGVGALARRRRA